MKDSKVERTRQQATMFGRQFLQGDGGVFDQGYDNEHFSPQDKRGNDAEGVPGYLGTPGGTIQKYSPDPRKRMKGRIKKLKEPAC